MKLIKQSCLLNQHGFTLLEILVTIIITSILAVILAQVVAGQTARSYEPILIINDNLALHAVMDNIAADYRKFKKINDSSQLITLQANIKAGNYWNNTSLTNNMEVEALKNSCIGFNAANSEIVTSNDVDCTPTDNYLKVTLGIKGTSHTVSTLFTRVVNNF